MSVFEELELKTKGWHEYIPGKSLLEIAKLYKLPLDKLIKLNSNENALGCSKKVGEAIKTFLARKAADLNFYPEATGESLVESLESFFVPQEKRGEIQIAVANGMDSVIESITRLLLDANNRPLIINPTFEYYKIASLWSSAQPVFLKTNPEENFLISSQKVIQTLEHNRQVKLVFLCNPNNPTGTLWELAELKNILEFTREKKIWVFLDEAYTEYVRTDAYLGQNQDSPSLLSWISDYPNLIIGRTFSKIYGLAALRIGWVAFHRKLGSYYQKVKVPFDNSHVSLIAAQTALLDQKFLDYASKINQRERLSLIEALKKFGFRVFSTEANFVSFLAGENFAFSAQLFTQALLKKGIVIRDASKFSGAPPDLVRLTVGKPEQNQKVLELLSTIV